MSKHIPQPASQAEPVSGESLRAESGISSFLARRWRGEAPLVTVFWRDMILYGSAINIAAGFTALMLIAAGFSTTTALCVLLAPLPWNLFLVLSVWRSGAHAPPADAMATRAGAAVWFAVALMI